MTTQTQPRQPAWKELMLPAVLWLLLAASLSYAAQLLSAR